MVHTNPFRGPTAFMMGNEGQGLSEKQMEVCDHFVRICQYSDATASLNVNIACSIVLHHYALWAQLPETSRTGYKYDRPECPPSSIPHSGIGLRQMKDAADAEL
eukprot:TRINITY_DN2501_c0_g1_i3.p3 TRINITY_DN2501_c0_g1~~TRINITY_DN2501_c0_g1_i3.p3  ORF type:complete len:104 (+),score=18.64 TRINITY_DN2501_c0_g1_i3:640-951(+)